MEDISSIMLYVVLGMLICWFYMSANGCGRRGYDYMVGEPDFVNNPMIGRDNKPFEFANVKGVQNIEGAVGEPPVEVGPPVNSYSDIIKNYAIGEDVVRSHREYIMGTPHTTTIASTDTERSDPNDIVPWSGLPRYRSTLVGQDGARVVSSELPNQVPYQKQPYCI